MGSDPHYERTGDAVMHPLFFIHSDRVIAQSMVFSQLQNDSAITKL